MSKHKIINIKPNISLSNNDITKNIERNKLNTLEFIKTDAKNSDEYIKITDIFKKSNNSIKLSHFHKVKSNKNIQAIRIASDLHRTPDKNNSFIDDKKNYFLINSNEKKNNKIDIDKIYLRQKRKKIVKRKKTLKKSDFNGLTDDIMKPSFLKNNISANLNNNNEKDKKSQIKKSNMNLK